MSLFKMASFPPPSVPISSSSSITSSIGKSGKGNSKSKGQRLTHFICLPLVTDTSRVQLQKSLELFKKDLLGGKLSSIEESDGLVSGVSGGRVDRDSGGSLDGGAVEVSEGRGGSGADGLGSGMLYFLSL